MAPFSTFEFYRDMYKGKLSEECYNSAVVKANSRVVSSINGRNVPQAMNDNVMLCECELTDVIFEFAQIPNGISSVNNDGYSVVFGGRNSNDGLNGENDVCKEVCVRYLQSPINLMCRWV